MSSEGFPSGLPSERKQVVRELGEHILGMFDLSVAEMPLPVRLSAYRIYLTVAEFVLREALRSCYSEVRRELAPERWAEMTEEERRKLVEKVQGLFQLSMVAVEDMAYLTLRLRGALRLG